METKEQIFIDGPGKFYPFIKKGQLFHAEWSQSSGWLFSDWEFNGIVNPSAQLFKAFEATYPDLAEHD